MRVLLLSVPRWCLSCTSSSPVRSVSLLGGLFCDVVPYDSATLFERAVIVWPFHIYAFAIFIYLFIYLFVLQYFKQKYFIG